MEERYISCMLLHAVGDRVGYKNGDWEFHPAGTIQGKTLEKLYEFIALGGVNHIDLKNWIVSDDTVLHIQTAAAIVEGFDTINEFGKNLKKNLIDAFLEFQKEGLKLRQPGSSTIESLKMLYNGKDWNELPYDFYKGGSGASMRSLAIGLAFAGKKNRHQLVQVAIESGRTTNNSAVGYLGAMASALFVALAVEGVSIKRWPFVLLDLFNDGIIEQYIKSVGRDVAEYERDHHIFVEKWIRYTEDKFDEDGNVVDRKMSINPVLRSRYYDDNFSFIDPITQGRKEKQLGEHSFIGSGGDDSVIIAYDALIDSGDNWEKLVVYSMLHSGDTDTTGSIAGGLYGILYGRNIPKNFIKDLEYKDILIDLAKRLFEFNKTRKNK